MNESLGQNTSKSASHTKWDSLANLEEDNNHLKIRVTRLGNVDILYDKQMKDAATNVLNELIMPISDEAIDSLAEYATNLSYDKDANTVRDEIYKSIYDIRNLTPIEGKTEAILSGYDNIETRNQDSSYKWVEVNGGCGTCESRFYIAPTANNTHGVIRQLAQTFSDSDTPVSFKYKLSTSKHTNHCDRIIIYNGVGKKEEVERGISDIYKNNPELFEGAERSPVWIGDSSVPGVYFAPETPGYSYGNRAMQALRAAKTTSDFLWSNMPAPSYQELKGIMKILIPSIMFRFGLFATNDGRTIRLKTKLADDSLGSFYDEITKIRHPQSTDELIVYGDLRHEKHLSENREYEVTFSQSREGKEAFLQNFYGFSLNNDRSIPGMTKKII